MHHGQLLRTPGHLDESLVEGVTPPLLDESTPLLSDEPYERQDLDELCRSGANLAAETDHDEDDFDEDSCSDCGDEIDGDGADGRCGSCADADDRAVLGEARGTALAAGSAWAADPDDLQKQRQLSQAADQFVDLAVDRGDDYDDIDHASSRFAEDRSGRARGEALIAALEAYDLGDDEDDGDDYDPDLAYQQMVGAGYSPDVADEVASSASSYESAFDMVVQVAGR